MSVTISTVNVGTTANDGTGDDVRDAFIKVNNSLSNLKSFSDSLLAPSASINITKVSTDILELTAGGPLTHNIIGNIYLTGQDTIYVDGSPVTTSAVTFSGGNVPGLAAFLNSAGSNSSETGAVTVTGGLGVGQNIFAGGIGVFSGNLVANSATDASSVSAAALISKGGLGVAKSAYIGQQLYVTGSTNLSSSLVVSGTTSITSSSASTNSSTGALIVAGGVGIGGNLNITGIQSTITGNMAISGDLTVSGNLAFGTEALRVSDNIIDLHTEADLSPLTFDNGRDVGFKFHYYKPGYGDSHAFAGWANDSGSFEYYDRGSEVGGIFVGTSYGTFKGGGLLAVNTTPATSTTTGAIVVSGGIGVAGNIYSGGNVIVTGNTSAANGSFTSINIANALNISGVTTTGNLKTTSGIFWANGASYGTTFSESVSANSLLGNTLASGIINSNLTSVGTLSGLVMAGNIVPSANVTYNLGSSTSWFNNIYGVAIQAQYADLAENYQADAQYKPGTVVVFGGKDEVTISSEFADVSVAGVISTNPAYLMNALDPGLPIALRGRVPVHVIGQVKKGDLLVTSDSPGYAASVGRNANYGPAVFAKALQDKDDDGVGTIEAVII